MLLIEKIGSDFYFQSQEVKFTCTSTGTPQEFYLVFFCGKTGSSFLYRYRAVREVNAEKVNEIEV